MKALRNSFWLSIKFNCTMEMNSLSMRVSNDNTNIWAKLLSHNTQFHLRARLPLSSKLFHKIGLPKSRQKRPAKCKSTVACPAHAHTSRRQDRISCSLTHVVMHHNYRTMPVLVRHIIEPPCISCIRKLFPSAISISPENFPQFELA